MSDLARFSVSLESDLLATFDRLIERQGYATRSEAVKALMRAALVDEQWEQGGRVAGAFLMVYDHHKHDLVHQLMEVQHDYGDVIISSQHVHLDHDHCLETITMKGAAARLRRLVSALRAVKGIKHTSLLTSSAGAALP